MYRLEIMVAVILLHLSLCWGADQKETYETDTANSASTPITELPKLVVSASRWSEKSAQVPQKVLLISPADAAFTVPQTSADLLAASDMVFVQKSQLGGGSPMIRGFSANRLLIVVDGVRMNNAIYRSGNLQNVISIDPLSVQSTEVLFGPGSVVYGSDAIGGVMDFRTLTPSLATEGLPQFSSNVITRVASAAFEKVMHFDCSAGFTKWAALASVSFTDFDDLIMGSKGNGSYVRAEYVDRVNNRDTVVVNSNENQQRYSGYNQLHMLGKIHYKPFSGLSVTGSTHFSTTSDIPRYDRLIQYKKGKLRYGEWYYGPQEWFMTTLTVDHTADGGIYDNMKTIIAGQKYNESRHSRAFGEPLLLNQEEQVYVGSIATDFRTFVGASGVLTYGLEATCNTVDSKAQTLHDDTAVAAASRYPNARYVTGALYGSYKHTFNPVWTMSSGLRLNYVRCDGTFDTTLFSLPYNTISQRTSACNGSLGLTAHLSSNRRVFLNFSSGFRAPNVDDLGKLFDPAPGSIVVPNPSLGPEYACNSEVGVEMATDVVSTETTVFYTNLTDAMVVRPSTLKGSGSTVFGGDTVMVTALDNADRAYVYGASFSLKVALPLHLTVRGSATYTHGEEYDDAAGRWSPLRHAAPFSCAMHGEYNHNSLRIDVYGLWNDEVVYKRLAQSERNKPYLYASDSNGDPYCPMWYTLNLKAAYTMNNRITVNCGVENILDVRYRPYSSGIVAPGRNFILGVRAHFGK